MKNTYSRVKDHNTKFFWGVLLLCVAAITLAIEARSAEIPSATLVLFGDTIPGGNGTFSGFEPRMSLNNDGQVAFIAFLAGTPDAPNDEVGIYLADTQSISQLVRTGQSVPNGNGTFRNIVSGISATSELSLNDNGSVAFSAQLNGTSGGVNDSYGMFGASAIGVVKQYLRASDAAPGGNGVFPHEPPPSRPGLDNLGNISFYSMLDATSGGQGVDDDGIFRSDGGTVIALARAGEPVPGDTETFVKIFPWLASNIGGQVVFGVDLFSFEFVSQQTEPQRLLEEESLLRIYRSSGSNLQEVARAGMSINNATGVFSGFGNKYAPRIADNGDVVFGGVITESGGGTSLLHLNGASLFKIAKVNELGPGESLFRFAYFTGVAINNDTVVFSAILERNAVPPDNRSSAIYLWSGQSLTTIVHQGDAVPGGNGTFGNVANPVFINNSGEFVFSAELVGTNDPVNDKSVIYFVDSGGTMHEMARFGKPLAGSTIVFAGYPGHFVDDYYLEGSGAGLAGTRVINDSGQVAYTAVLADGRWGLFLWNASNQEPDPGFIFEDSFE